MNISAIYRKSYLRQFMGLFMAVNLKAAYETECKEVIREFEKRMEIGRASCRERVYWPV